MPRRKRDEGKPKRGMTAYMLFCQDKRPEIKEKHPNASFGEIGKLLGEAWKEIEADDKKTFEEKAAKDKIRYQKELAAYKTEHPEESDDEKKGKKGKKNVKKRKTTKKDPDAPKKPCTAFVWFSKEQRPKIKEQNPKASFGEIGKLLGAAWKEVDADDKKRFEGQAAEDKKRYERENKEYESKKKKEQEEAASSSSDSESESESSSDSDSD